MDPIENGRKGVPQEPAEIAAEILSTGRTPEQFLGMLDVVGAGIENGVLREQISCFEHKSGFFEMARRFYVDSGEPRMSDAELGMHEGSCESPICAKLTETYWNVLRTSSAEDSANIAEQLDSLEADLLRGILREDLIGQRSGLYDSDTDRTLPIAKAVDITGLCMPQDGEVVLIYTQPVAGTRVDIDMGGSRVGYFVKDEGGLMDPEDALFVMRARRVGIDPRLLLEAVLLNAPEEPSESMPQA